MRAIEIAELLEHSALGNLGDFAYVADAAKELRRLALVEIKLAAAEIELATANANLVAIRGQEPVAWQSTFSPYHDFSFCSKEHAEWVNRVPQEFKDYKARALYAAPVPQTLETLDKPARVRGVVFGPGVKVITVIQAAQRCAEEYVPEDAPGIQQEILRGLHNLARPSAVELQAAEIGIPVPATELINPVHPKPFTRSQALAWLVENVKVWGEFPVTKIPCWKFSMRNDSLEVVLINIVDAFEITKQDWQRAQLVKQ